MRSLTRAIADPYAGKSLSGRARARRWVLFASLFPDISEMRVLDLGGDTRNWVSSPVRPREVVLVNVFFQPSEVDWMSTAVGDACDLPHDLRGKTFDLVYSNSVIEHVGGAWRRGAFAQTVADMAPRHWVQTPYRYFPLEPHWLFPGFQLLPLAARAAVTRRWKLGHRHAADRKTAVESSLSVELLSRTEMRHLFPDSRLHTERMAGLPKSMIAVR